MNARFPVVPKLLLNPSWGFLGRFAEHVTQCKDVLLNLSAKVFCF